MDILEFESQAAPIRPVAAVAGWKKKALTECGDPLVPIGLDAPKRRYRLLHNDPIYFGLFRQSSPYVTWLTPYHKVPDLPGALITAFVRSWVADALLKSQSRLPRGMRLVVCDSYRPLEVQAALYRFYYDQLKALHPDWGAEALAAETQRYVSLPSSDPFSPSPHNTGGAVDVIVVRLPEAFWDEIDLIDAQIMSGNGGWEEQYPLQMRRAYLLNSVATPLPFGERFDHGGERAGLRYYEDLAAQRPRSPHERRGLVARRILAEAMIGAGFQGYPDEFWHFNLGNQMAAQVAGDPDAIYGGVELSDANRIHEAMLVQHWRNVWQLAIGHRWQPEPEFDQEYRLVVDVVERQGNPLAARTAQMAEVIAPAA